MTTRLWGGAALATVACVVAAAPRDAQAQVTEETKKKAREYYDRGQTAYNLGRFDDAITEFSKGFEIYPEPVFLYNIAQSHRQKGEWERAKFFYKRYLSLAPTASNKAEVEKRIVEMDEEIAKARLPKQPDKTPDRPDTPPDTQPQGQGETPPDTQPQGETPPSEPATEINTHDGPDITSGVVRPHPIFLSASAGPTFVSFGSDLSVPTQVAASVSAGYLFTSGKLGVGAGVGFDFTNIPWSNDTGSEELSGTATFLGLGANVRLLYAVTAKIDIRLEAGAGVTWWTGLERGNPFTNGGEASEDGPVPMFSFRGAFGIDYHVTPALALGLTPIAFSGISKPENTSDDVERIQKIDILVGIAYSL
jgi:hypothetical protein